jgi:purine-binding chemotaxis protein CheW
MMSPGMALAQASTPAAKLVCFEVRGERFGASITSVKETLVLRPITRVFLVPPFVAGLVNLRGDVVAVLDLGVMLGLPEIGVTDDSRIVLVRASGRSAGLLVDRLLEPRSYEALADPPATLAPETAALVAGVLTEGGGVPLAVLDVDRLLDDERLRPFARKG